MKKIFLFIIAILALSSCTQEDIENIVSTNTVEPQKTILFLGDSLTAGYRLDVADSYPKQLQSLLQENNYSYKVINGGVSGNTSQNLLDRIELYDDISVDMYFVAIGANDGLRQQSLEDMKNNIENTLQHIKQASPEATIILSGMQLPLNTGVQYSKEFTEIFPAIAKQEKILLFPFLLEWVARKQELNLDDGIHPNKQGYTIIADNIYQFFIQNNLVTQ